MPHELWTAQGQNLAGTPWTNYPRPQMRRESYVNLNGQWAFACGDFAGTILVPFCPESRLSGVNQHFSEGEQMRYRRKLELPEGFNIGRVLLHIGAADQHLECYVNQKKVGTHHGGYTPMTFDITDALGTENELELRITDDLRDLSMPYGKQVLPQKRGGMWYTPVSGIWQSVWLESVPEQYIHRLKIENRDYGVVISTEPKMAGTITVDGLGEFVLTDGMAEIEPQNPRLWSPEDPQLYDFTVTCGEDTVHSYFALRKLEIQNVDGLPRLCLNGKPYFFHGLLDQGYWPDGIYTPADPSLFAEDILAMKALGFNTLRKHIKIEPQEFYYQCDRLGMVVFQDMVNNGPYSFLRDTALPTVGFQKLPDKRMHKDPKSRREFMTCMEETVHQLENYPCICYWTIFNEGWGQFDADSAYDALRKLDGTRFVDATSGWFRRKKSDVDSRHVYFRKVKLKASDKPLVLSEFGGYSFKPHGHVFNTESTYGYGKFEDLEAFQNALTALYTEQIIPAKEAGLCAAIYTQVSDVEDETNGLLSYDRKVTKVKPEAMLPIADKLKF